mmetsp:Transcript_82976/g.262115  ORF Transcript_82976/g.262115 Transcript_82976/m.262115 type:complete len:256 (+) Transcript_82976:271-1038(+)
MALHSAFGHLCRAPGRPLPPGLLLAPAPAPPLPPALRGRPRLRPRGPGRGGAALRRGLPPPLRQLPLPPRAHDHALLPPGRPRGPQALGGRLAAGARVRSGGAAEEQEPDRGARRRENEDPAAVEHHRRGDGDPRLLRGQCGRLHVQFRGHPRPVDPVHRRPQPEPARGGVRLAPLAGQEGGGRAVGHAPHAGGVELHLRPLRNPPRRHAAGLRPHRRAQEPDHRRLRAVGPCRGDDGAPPGCLAKGPRLCHRGD